MPRYILSFLIGSLCLSVQASSFDSVSCETPPREINYPCSVEANSPCPAISCSASIDCGFIAKASYLYWQAKEDGLEYVVTSDQAGDIFEGFDIDFTHREPNFKWESGLQAGLGYIISEREQWDFLANWTYFHTKAKDSIATDPNDLPIASILRPNWLPFILGSVSTAASANLTLNLNVLDFTLGRDFYVGNWLTFHPRFGLRWGWLHQNYRAKFDSYNLFAGMPSIVPIGTTSFTGKWSYQAGGIRFGTDAEWLISRQFSLVVNAFASILYGKYKVAEVFDGGFVVDIGGPHLIPETVNLDNRYFRIRPVFETEGGLKWHTLFSKGKREASLGVYYGLSYWFNQNALVNEFLSLDLSSGNSFVTSLPANGDLSMQGLRIQSELDF